MLLRTRRENDAWRTLGLLADGAADKVSVVSRLAETLRPHFARAERAQAILLAAVLAAGGRWKRKTTLWKAFWWAHLECMKELGAELSDYPVVRLPQGPAPDDGDLLIDSLASSGYIVKGDDGDPRHPAETFSVPDNAKAKAWIEGRLSAQESVVVDRAALKFKDMTAREASDFSHAFSLEWNEQRNGVTMNIYRDLLPKERLTRAVEETRDAEAVLAAAFKTKPARG